MPDRGAVTAAAVAALALAAMEPAAALAHRGLMHGPGWPWHRSHHRQPGGPPQANDLYPLVFAAATVLAMAIGAAVPRLGPLLAAGAGVTAYGVLYLVVHDLYVHERLGPLPGRGSRYVRWVAGAHALHHRTGREPYGFLVPVIHRRIGEPT
jgi:beta-carotene 3-hydroxylase